MSELETPGAFLSSVAGPLQDPLRIYWQRWCEACEQHGIDPRLDSLIPLQRLGYLFACSDYVARTAIRAPGVLQQHLRDGLDSPIHQAALENELTQCLQDVTEAENDRLRKHLRVFRHRHTLRIALRDLLNVADIEQLLIEQSELAAVIVDMAARRVQQNQTRLLGMPRNADGRPQQLVVLAMGKLGGGELNFSSDIDLIFCYPQDGKADGRGALSNYEYFLRVIRELVPLLDDVTEDGFVYRVDTRLRPYGASGPLAMSFNALENYYQSQGREWERYAMIKARAVSGDADDIEQLTAILKPFVYRRYLDYSVFDGIREMKSMIEQQVKRESMQGNIKLGSGGIREIEFIAQTFQLIRGGRDVRLQSASLLATLARLAEQGLLQQQEVDDLRCSYRYLRVLENRLQIEADQQKHELPTDESLQLRLVLAMACDDWQTLVEMTAGHTSRVRQLFDGLIQQQAPESADGLRDLTTVMMNYFGGAWQHAESSQDMLDGKLQQQGISLCAAELDVIDSFRASAALQNASSTSKKLCAQLLVALLAGIEQDHASYTLKRLLTIMQAVLGRPVYLSMMAEYPTLQRRLIWLCQSGEWFTEQMRAMPILLDELIENDVEHTRPMRQQLAVELDNAIDAVPSDDAEMVLDSLRVFKQSSVFRVAMLDIIGEHKVTDLSDLLSDIAELLVNKTLDLAWHDVVLKHGSPVCEIDGERCHPGLAVIGYGKLGGIELGYGSDLDMVFIHNSRGDKQCTDGDRPLDNSAFFARVVQKFLHLMSTRTLSGVLYEIDTRLRPDGGAGLLVTSTEAFQRYQQDRAWTWEHQALIRARAVAGDPNAVEEFDRIRSSVLARSRDWPQLAADVVGMRNRMREHLSGKQSGLDLKQDMGGLVDIEFIAQAGVLQLAAAEPTLLQTTATILLLASLGHAGWLSEAEVATLCSAYAALRRAHNYRSLGVENPALIRRCQQLMPEVGAVWNRLFLEFDTQVDSSRP